ncbi:MAG: hypothetical protein WC369_06935 [Dehalococcoidales bacterium]
MHVDLDAFFIAAELRDRSELRGKPVVVGGKPHQQGVVAAAFHASACGHYPLCITLLITL